MKKGLWVLLAFGVCAYFGYSAITARNARLERERSHVAETKSIQNAVLSMVQRNGAIDDWDTQLAEGETVRVGPVMTIDLERLWLKDKPIMFSGLIGDIKTYDNQNYTVTINRNLLSTVTIIGAELRLDLMADKKLIDAFLEQWPQVKNDGVLDAGVVVIAKIKSIQSGEVSTGIGQLLDIMYTGRVMF